MSDKLKCVTEYGYMTLEITNDGKTLCAGSFPNETSKFRRVVFSMFDITDVWDLLKDNLSVIKVDRRKLPGLHRRKHEAIAAKMFAKIITSNEFMEE